MKHLGRRTCCGLFALALAALGAEAPAVSPAQAFVQALEGGGSTAEQRAEAWAKLVEGGAKPPKAVVAAVDKARGRAWDALAALVASLSSQKPVAGLRSAIASHQAKVRDVVTGNAFSNEALDAAMAPVQGALDAALAALQAGANYAAVRAALNEREGYAVGCGLRHGWSDELLDTLCTLAVVNRYAGSSRWQPALDANQLVGEWIDPGEAACVARLNVHRILIGLPPMETDLRLVAAAKKHAEEMAAKGYFAHDSPTAELKTPWQRAAREQTRASGECIASGRTSGVGAFTGWYYSQPHHRIIIGAAPCVGVGRAGDRWTLMTGTSRLLGPKTDRMAQYVRQRYAAGDKPEALFELARWCATNQLLVQAQDELERVVALDPNHDAAKKALERLRSRKR